MGLSIVTKPPKQLKFDRTNVIKTLSLLDLDRTVTTTTRTSMTTMMKTSFLLLLSLLLSSQSSARSLRGLSTRSRIRCRIFIVDTMYEHGGEIDEVEEVQTCGEVIDGVETDDWYTISLPDVFTEVYGEEIEEGTLVLDIENAIITNDDIELLPMSIVTPVEQIVRHRQLSRQIMAKGRTSVMMVRVSVQDSEPVASAADLEGIFANGINFKSQYDACSFGQFEIVGAGVMEVNINQPIANFPQPGSLVNLASEAARMQGGVPYAAALADKVMFCLPPGTGSWAASAGVGHWRSVYNNEWCTSLSANVHELGHSLGLLHSNMAGQAYADKTGYMSFGRKDKEGPLKCFNGHKSWLLGWYSSRHITVDGPAHIKLASFVDFAQTAEHEPVIANVLDKYYLMFNQAKGFNKDTEGKPDMLTITEAQTGGSDSVAGLEVGDSVELEGGLIIEVCEEISGPPDALIVSVHYGESACGNKFVVTHKPSPAPTYPKTNSPTVGPTVAPTVAQTVTNAPTVDSSTQAPASNSVVTSASLVSDIPSMTPTMTASPTTSPAPTIAPTISAVPTTSPAPSQAPSNSSHPTVSSVPIVSSPTAEPTAEPSEELEL